MRISDWSSDVCSSDLHSAANPQIAVGVDRAGVAGMIPAVSVDRRLIGSPPIALHDAVRSHHDLPDRVGAERMVLFVDDADLDSRHRRARRGQQAPAVGAMIVGGGRTGRASCRERVWKYV